MRFEKRVTAMKESEPLAPCSQTDSLCIEIVYLLCMLSYRLRVWFCISIPEFLSSILNMQSLLGRQIEQNML